MSNKIVHNNKKSFLGELIEESPIDEAVFKERSGYTRQHWWDMKANNKIPPFGRLKKLLKASGVPKDRFYEIINKHLMG